MSGELPLMHHVVFAVAPERLDAAMEFLEALGLRFQTHELPDVGLRVTLDWDRGIELVTPTADSPSNPGSVADFLAQRGEDVDPPAPRLAGAQNINSSMLR
jgi:hypothetical protein